MRANLVGATRFRSAVHDRRAVGKEKIKLKLRNGLARLRMVRRADERNLRVRNN